MKRHSRTDRLFVDKAPRKDIIFPLGNRAALAFRLFRIRKEEKP